ncbi:hypothetical protein KM043_009241 [Ampulex compressa]|nr:hypothetical protein KM043_009241 [Ampulex compressa]
MEIVFYRQSSYFHVAPTLERNSGKVRPKIGRLIAEEVNEREITANDEDEDVTDEFDAREIFDLIRNINDPEHPLTLEELNVVEQSLIKIDNKTNKVHVKFTPTIPHCSMATLIGLSIRVQLLRALPSRFKVNVEITPGTHVSETAVNKQLADKERVAAALENIHLLEVINQCVGIKC